MMRAIFVRAFSGLFFVAFNKITKMAHEFCSVLPLVVLARVHLIQI